MLDARQLRHEDGQPERDRAAHAVVQGVGRPRQVCAGALPRSRDRPHDSGRRLAAEQPVGPRPLRRLRCRFRVARNTRRDETQLLRTKARVERGDDRLRRVVFTRAALGRHRHRRALELSKRHTHCCDGLRQLRG